MNGASWRHRSSAATRRRERPAGLFDEFLPICFDEWMKDDNNDITNSELASRIDTVAANLAQFAASLAQFIDEARRFHQDVRTFQAETQSSLTELQTAAFTVEEKEEVLSAVKHIDERLENDALGKGDITLTRPEYDATAVAANFLNRFERPREAWAE